MSTIQITGLASGLDVNTIIDSLVKAESVPITQLTTKKTNVEAASSTLTAIETKLSTLRTAASALADPVQFSSYSTKSSDTAIVATVSGSPAPGSFDVSVSQIASEQRTYSDKQGSSTADLNLSGTLSIQVGAKAAVDVTVDATDSLTEIAAKINQTGERLSASVIFDGTDYRLQVRGLDTGASNAVAFTENGFTLGLTKVANTYQKAQNAKLKVDNIDFERSTNQVVGVIPGVTLALTKATASAATITVASDPTALAAKINTFVTAYNDVVKASHDAAGYGTTEASNALLAGDSSIRTMLDKLQRVIGGKVTGASGKFEAMTAVGLESNRDGTISLNQVKLASAIADDSASVSRLFVVDAKTGSTGAMGTMKSVIDALTVGKYATLQNRIEALDKTATDIDTQKATLQRRVDGYKALLTAQFAALEEIMTKTKTQTAALNNIPDVYSKSDK